MQPISHSDAAAEALASVIIDVSRQTPPSRLVLRGGALLPIIAYRPGPVAAALVCRLLPAGRLEAFCWVPLNRKDSHRD